MTMSYKRRAFVIALLVLLLGTAVPAFSQEIIASFGVGGEFHTVEATESYSYWDGLQTNYSYRTYTRDVPLLSWGLNALFVGRTGFTLSTELNLATDFDNYVIADPSFGLGYVFYRIFYLGAILNAVPRIQLRNGYVSPTVVFGFDFGTFALQAQAAYMFGVMDASSGFRFSIGAGTNVGRSWLY